jgi:aspartokinase/homoserine dehydrogenase 1
MRCRECGIDIELADVPVHSLVPEPLREVESVAEFMRELPKYDGDMATQLQEAEDAGECLRFVGKA